MVLPNIFWQGIEQFNQRQFYCCHDTLESIWLESSEPDKTFYQSILQIAVGCYHLERSNWKGAVTLLGEGIKKLRDYQPSYEGVEVCELLDSSFLLLKEIQQIKPEDLAKHYPILASLIPTIGKI
ncbi:MAG: DUF309 domain-containing protein [Cyanobacteriota bacterium ELA615]